MFITSKEIGIIGENIACRYLTKKKYKIIERNYRKKCGEIDIIAEKDDIIYFFEVKTNELSNNYIRPEERITPKKLRKIKMTAELYQLEKKIEKDVGVRSISVLIDVEGKEAKVYMLKNIL